jgi:uncharacterized protein
MARVPRPSYMSFPLRVGPDGPRQSERTAHVREQIEQILFTDPGERVFRPEYGAGLRSLVFEPQSSPVWAITQKRLLAALGEALQGEVDPKTLRVELGVATGQDAAMVVEVSYTLAAIGLEERHRLPVAGTAGVGRG